MHYYHKKNKDVQMMWTFGLELEHPGRSWQRCWGCPWFVGSLMTWNEWIEDKINPFIWFISIFKFSSSPFWAIWQYLLKGQSFSLKKWNLFTIYKMMFNCKYLDWEKSKKSELFDKKNWLLKSHVPMRVHSLLNTLLQ